MIVSSYRKSLWVLRVLSLVFAIAMAAVFWKLGQTVHKISLYDRALAYYRDDNLLLAEETFSRAEAISAIRYGDEAWSRSMSALTAIRAELESLAAQAEAASREQDHARMLAVYERYRTLAGNYASPGGLDASFFRQTAQRLALGKQVDDYFQRAKDGARRTLETNLAQKSFHDDSFVATLVLIPDEYYGGAENKQRELSRLLRAYDREKFRASTGTGTFSEVVARTADSLRAYKRLNIEAEWLTSFLESYAEKEIRTAVRQDDLAVFIALAKAYRQIEDVLPPESEALDEIESHLQARLRQAERYIAAGQYEKAIELYRQIGPLQDTSALIAEAESLWSEDDPARLLAEKHPDNTYRFVLTGEQLWGTQAYAIGLTQGDQPELHLAGKMADGTVVYLERAVSSGHKPLRLTLSDIRGIKKAPLILLEAEGTERTHLYSGFIPDMERSSLVKGFEIEAEGFQAENPEEIILTHPTGDGENEVASFRLEEKGLVYTGKIEDYLPEGADEADTPPVEESMETPDGAPPDIAPPTATERTGQGQHREPGTGTHQEESGAPPDIAGAAAPITLYAGPGEQYGQIGELPAKAAVEVLAEADGWYQISYQGKKGWINRMP